MEDAHRFQEAFFEEIGIQMKRRSDDDDDDDEDEGNSQQQQQQQGSDENDAEGVLDLALALQKAVVRVSRNGDGRRKAPYHWAAFMLQGFWKAIPISSFRPK